MNRKLAAMLGAALAVIAIVLFIALRPSNKASSATGAPNATGSGSAGGAPTPHVTKALKDPAARQKIVDAIKQAQQKRAANGTGSSTSSGGTSGTAGKPPTLPPEAPGMIDKQYIRAAVKDIIPLLAECYTQGLERDPKLGGKVIVEFTIEGEAEVGTLIGQSSIDPAKSDIKDAQVLECLQETMYALQIDAPPAGGKVSVTYPFEFRSE